MDQWARAAGNCLAPSALLLSPSHFFMSQRESLTEARGSLGILKCARSIVGYQSELVFSLVSSLRLLSYHPSGSPAGGQRSKSVHRWQCDSRPCHKGKGHFHILLALKVNICFFHGHTGVIMTFSHQSVQILRIRVGLRPHLGLGHLCRLSLWHALQGVDAVTHGQSKPFIKSGGGQWASWSGWRIEL